MAAWFSWWHPSHLCSRWTQLECCSHYNALILLVSEAFFFPEGLQKTKEELEVQLVVELFPGKLEALGFIFSTTTKVGVGRAECELEHRLF